MPIVRERLHVRPPALARRFVAADHNGGSREDERDNQHVAHEVALYSDWVHRIPPPRRFLMTKYRGCLLALAALGISVQAAAQARLQSSDLLKLRSVSGVRVSPDGTRVAYVVESNDGPGVRPASCGS
jgi:hypothetical protein